MKTHSKTAKGFGPVWFRTTLFCKSCSPEALLTCKIQGFPALQPPKQRFGCIFTWKTQPNHGFGPPAAAKPCILHVFGASGDRLFKKFSPRSSVFAPPCSLASLLAPRLARVLARALVPASVRVLPQASVPATVLPLALALVPGSVRVLARALVPATVLPLALAASLALDPGMAVIRVSLAFGCESLVPTS